MNVDKMLEEIFEQQAKVDLEQRKLKELFNALESVATGSEFSYVKVIRICNEICIKEDDQNARYKYLLLAETDTGLFLFSLDQLWTVHEPILTHQIPGFFDFTEDQLESFEAAFRQLIVKTVDATTEIHLQRAFDKIFKK